MLSDDEWARIESLMPSASSKGGRPFRDHRRVIEAIVWRYRVGAPWRDLPAEFGPWQTAWKRHRRFAGDGTWDKILGVLLTEADADGRIDWRVSRLDRQSRAPARHEPCSHHRGISRITRICSWSRVTMELAGLEGV